MGLERETIVKYAGVGLVAGFFSALFGVGGGIIIVPLLVMFCAFEQRQASATSLAAIVIASVAGALTYGIHGELKPGAAALVGIPAVAGVLIGSSLQQRISNRMLTYGFGVLLAAIGVRLLV
jgi:uncharacterized membrane protein YfcA